jgi:hypothetical protein
MKGRKDAVTLVNKLVKNPDVTGANIAAMFMKLILADPEYWGPKFDIYYGKKSAPIESDAKPLDVFGGK